MDCECGGWCSQCCDNFAAMGEALARNCPVSASCAVRYVGSTDDNLYALAGAPVCMATTPVPTVPAPTPTPLPDHPRIAEVQSPVLAGADFTIKGSGFTKGSEINFFVSTSMGPINEGPIKPTTSSTTSNEALRTDRGIDIPKSLTSRHGASCL